MVDFLGVCVWGRERKDVACIHIDQAKTVPRATWLWMEQIIMDEDKNTRQAAQGILQPRDDRMRYIIATLQHGRSDAIGRNLRMTRMLNYSVTRQYTRRNPAEDADICVDRGRIHLKMNWGWRLLQSMSDSFRKAASEVTASTQ